MTTNIDLLPIREVIFESLMAGIESRILNNQTYLEKRETDLMFTEVSETTEYLKAILRHYDFDMTKQHLWALDQVHKLHKLITNARRDSVIASRFNGLVQSTAYNGYDDLLPEEHDGSLNKMRKHYMVLMA